MGAIKAALAAKADKHLSQLIRSSVYGVVTRRQRIEKALADGAALQVVLVRDEARERAIEREIQSLRKRNGWGVPANECHPTTIQFNKLKAELAGGPKTDEYRLVQRDATGGEFWNVLTKTEYDFAVTLLQE